jgi:hypothetical protein
MNLEYAFQKIIFLLGAGASKDANCKLSNDMLESLKSSIINMSLESIYIDSKNDFLEIYLFIQASLKYQLSMKDSSSSASINIEDFVMVLRQLIDKEFIVPYPLIGNWNDKILKWEIRNNNVFNHFKEFIVTQLVRDWTNFDSKEANKLLNPIREILNHPANFKINIFSLNYDLIFERTLNSPQEKFLDNGFTEKNIDGQHVRFWESDFDNPHSPTKINLFKLHGSIDWEYNKTTEEIIIKEDIFDGREPLIIFGSQSKMLSFDPFLFMLSKFRTLLEQATIFVVIGYSFHDKYINNLLIQQLSRNTQEDIPKKIIIIDPSYKGKDETYVAEYIKEIQITKSITDVINFQQVNPERIKVISKPASSFYKEYFSDYGKLLIQELIETERGYRVF